MGFDATFQQLLGTTPPGLLGQALIHAETVDSTPAPVGSLLDRAAVEFLVDEHGTDLTFAGLHEQVGVSTEDALAAFAQAAILTSVINRAAVIASPQTALQPIATADATIGALLPEGAIEALWRRLAKALHQFESLAAELKRRLDASVTITVAAPFALSLAITF
jgi:hypothetical protein